MMAAFQPYCVASQAVNVGANIPPALPHRFIQPETEAENLPPRSLQEVQEALKVNPNDPSDTVIHNTFQAGFFATAAR